MTPNDANALAGLGFVRLSQKRFDEALTLFETRVRSGPRRPGDVAEGYPDGSVLARHGARPRAGTERPSRRDSRV